MMPRVLEPELMSDPEQALVYAQADFEKENQGFVDRFRESFPNFSEGHVLDLGCGPGDIPVRFARAFPACRITGVDARERFFRDGRRVNDLQGTRTVSFASGSSSG